jgi:hypothetical protein
MRHESLSDRLIRKNRSPSGQGESQSELGVLGHNGLIEITHCSKRFGPKQRQGAGGGNTPKPISHCHVAREEMPKLQRYTPIGWRDIPIVLRELDHCHPRVTGVSDGADQDITPYLIIGIHDEEEFCS